MSIKKGFAITVMLVALLPIFAGISYVNNYTNKTTTQTPVFADSITVPVNGTGQIYVKLNATEAEYYVSLKIYNGSIRGAVVSKDEYAAWVNGSYKPHWYYDQPSSYWWGAGEYSPMLSNAPQERYYIFWNPDAPVSREVTLKICEQTTETTINYTTLGTGILLIAAGVVAGAVAAYTLGRRLLLTLTAFTLIVLGTFLVTTYPKTFEGKETVATDSLTIPAHNCKRADALQHKRLLHHHLSGA
jgi:hypothetical protein